VAVLIHGAGMDHTVWAHPARWLAHHGRAVLALDLPGHGGSGGEPLASIDAMAEWVWRVCDRLGLGQVGFAGHSMGSLVALAAAAARPARTRGLALLGTAMRMRVNPDLIALARARDPRGIELMVGWSFGAEGRMGGVGTPGLCPPTVMRRLLERGLEGALAADLAACDGYAGAEAACARIEGPATVVAGAEDRMTPPAMGRAVAAAIAGARAVRLDRVGHSMLAEAPVPTTRAMAEVL
jgi:pimeloyl-ACP methyl ester carboxylesterase